MSKRKKRSGRHRSRAKKAKNKKSFKKKGKDKAEEQKRASRKKKRALKDKDRRLKANFKARQRKQDIMFVIFLIIFAAIMSGGYYFISMYGDAGEDEATSDTIEPMNENNIAPNNGDDHVEPDKIKWHMYNEGLQLSHSNNKPVMIDFYFDGCYWCEELDKNTYTDTRVIEKAKSFISIKVDIYETDAYNGQGLASENNVQGCPTIVFLNAQGSEVNRIGGYEDANKFLADMNEALTKS